MPLMVAAIDFGTAYSGWGFSFHHEFKENPTKITAKQWIGEQLVSYKGPTCALIKDDGRTLEAFGYEAERSYAEYAEENCHKQYYFFKRFKMELYGQIGIERDTHIEDATGKKLPAKTVFALSIKYLKDDLLKTSESQVAGLTNDDIHWVLTVPAIWNDAAKQFMREAAEEAGFDSNKLTICLEPEAASIYCRNLKIEKVEDSLGKLKTGSQYLVVDAGGGTVDLTVHEVMFDGSLKELHKATGGAWGGTKVDEAFERFLNTIFGYDVTEQLKQDYMDDYIDLCRDFEVHKRDFKPNQTSKIAFRLPTSLVTLVKDTTGLSLNEQIAKTMYNDCVKLVRDKLKVEASVVQELFNEPVCRILDHIQTLLDQPNMRNCSIILMVGGFSESPMLQQKVREKFLDKKVIIPNEAGLVVLKGAVIFGHSPASISERICKMTYGRRTSHKQSSERCKHPPGRVEIDRNGDLRCYDLFQCHVKEGTSVKVAEMQSELLCYPKYDDQSHIKFQFFASTSPEVNFITENSCIKIGELTINITDMSLGRWRKFGVSFMFGGTEIMDNTTLDYSFYLQVRGRRDVRGGCVTKTRKGRGGSVRGKRKQVTETNSGHVL